MNLPERPEIEAELKERARRRQMGEFVPDSGGMLDDSLYDRQRAIRFTLLEWVKKHSSMSLRDYYTLSAKSSALMLPPKLLTLVGYEVSSEYQNLYAKLHEDELKHEHPGWKLIPIEAQQRFINDNETREDIALLNIANDQRIKEKNRREQELVNIVLQKGGVPKSNKRTEIRTFWTSVRAEWVKKHPENVQIKRPISNIFGYLGSIDEESSARRYSG